MEMGVIAVVILIVLIAGSGIGDGITGKKKGKP